MVFFFRISLLKENESKENMILSLYDYINYQANRNDSHLFDGRNK